MTHDYLDQLDQNVGIAPANSQEEYQAAQTIADIMRRHGVEPSIEEFDAKAFGGVMDQILFAMLFVGMLLVGIGAVPLTVIGFVLVALPVAAFVARYLGNDFVEKLGPSARSQKMCIRDRSRASSRYSTSPTRSLACLPAPWAPRRSLPRQSTAQRASARRAALT